MYVFLDSGKSSSCIAHTLVEEILITSLVDKDDDPGVNHAREPTQNGKKEIDPKVQSNTSFDEDGQRGQKKGKDGCDNVNGVPGTMTTGHNAQ